MSGGGGVLCDGIPVSLLKTIQDIKEIAGKHSDEDIYAMLKECHMDPNETAQKLLYLDAFHEVKSKRERRKSNVSNPASERNRWTSGMQQRGARGGRGNNSSGYFSNGTGGGQKRNPPLENGSTGHAPINAGLAGSVRHNSKSDTALPETSFSKDASRPTSLVGGNLMHESVPHDSEVNIVDIGHGTSADGVNKSGKRPARPSVPVKQLKTLNPGPTPAPTPPTAFTSVSKAGPVGRNLESATSDLLVSATQSGVYSSASDPVLLPSPSSQNPGAVGTIKHETGFQRVAPDYGNTSVSEIRLNVCQDDVNNGLVEPRTVKSNRKTFQGVEKDHYPEPSRLTSLLNLNDTTAAAPHQDGSYTKQANGSLNVMTAHLGATVSSQADMPSLPKVDDSVLGKDTSQLSRKLEGLNITSQNPVIFPDHIQVPEAYRSGLTFGSVDSSLVQNNVASEDVKPVDETHLGNEDDTKQSSLSLKIPSATAHEDEYPGDPESIPPMTENLSVLEVNISCTSLPTSEPSIPEISQSVDRSPYPFLHASPDYGFAVVPPMLAPQYVHVEGTEVSNSSISSTSGSSQPTMQMTVGVGQNSPAVSPPLIPYLQQPYPSNYFPYNPYFTQLYMPHSAPQFLGSSGFAQQGSTGNIYMPPPAAGTGVKFHVPPSYKPGTVAANLTHFGIPSGYGSYGSSALGYGISATVSPVSSSSGEDLTAPELKETKFYPILKQNEESPAWTSAPMRDLPSLQANFFYNFPHVQQVAYSPAQSGQGSLAGTYHLTATTAAPSIGQTLSQHSQVMIGSVDPAVPPAGTYLQPISQTGWNAKLLNRENI